MLPQNVSGLNRHATQQQVLNDPKNRLVTCYLHIVEFLRPRFLLMEQVCLGVLLGSGSCLCVVMGGGGQIDRMWLGMYLRSLLGVVCDFTHQLELDSEAGGRADREACHSVQGCQMCTPPALFELPQQHALELTVANGFKCMLVTCKVQVVRTYGLNDV